MIVSQDVIERQDIFEIVRQQICLSSAVDVEAEAITKDSWLVEFGFDSVNSVDLIMALEERFDIEIDDHDAVGIQTVMDIVLVIEQLLQAQASNA